MGKQFYDEESISLFVLRDIQGIHEPLISILKIVEETDDEILKLLNLMTGFVETTTKDRLLIDYSSLNGKELQKAFKYVSSSHVDLELSDIEGLN